MENVKVRQNWYILYECWLDKLICIHGSRTLLTTDIMVRYYSQIMTGICESFQVVYQLNWWLTERLAKLACPSHKIPIHTKRTLLYHIMNYIYNHKRFSRISFRCTYQVLAKSGHCAANIQSSPHSWFLSIPSMIHNIYFQNVSNIVLYAIMKHSVMSVHKDIFWLTMESVKVSKNWVLGVCIYIYDNRVPPWEVLPGPE